MGGRRMMKFSHLWLDNTIAKLLSILYCLIHMCIILWRASFLSFLSFGWIFSPPEAWDGKHLATSQTSDYIWRKKNNVCLWLCSNPSLLARQSPNVASSMCIISKNTYYKKRYIYIYICVYFLLYMWTYIENTKIETQKITSFILTLVCSRISSSCILSRHMTLGIIISSNIFPFILKP